MFLHKRKSTGYYYLHYRDEGGTLRSVSTRQKKKSDALYFLKNFKEREQEKKRRIDNKSLSDFKIGIKDVENFIAVKRQVSVHTARRCFVTVAAAFSKAVDWNYLSVNPFSKVKKPKLPETPPLFFTKDEFQKLLKCMNNREWIEFSTVAVLTGMRLSELINLKWEAVDLINRIIHVRNTDTFTTKSKKSRVIPMNEYLYKLLAKRKEHAVCEYVFHKKMLKLDRLYVSKKFKKFVIDAGINPKLKFHSLRHTCASWLVQSGIDLYTVQKILGHSSVNVTARYAHLQQSQLSDAMNRLKISDAVSSLP